MRRFLIYIFIAVPFLFACKGIKTNTENQEGDTLFFRYAKNISVIKYRDYTLVRLADPWHEGKTLHTYVLYSGDQKADAGIQGATSVRIPLSRCLITTSVHCSLAQMLGREKVVRGVCDAAYISSPWAKKGLETKRIADCGNSMSPNIEQIIKLSPDAIFLSPMQNMGGYGKVENLNIPIIELADYMEVSALGRAEWVKLYGLLFGAEREADSLFAVTEKNYNRLKAAAASTKDRPSVIMDKVEGGIWYQPGGKSTIAELLKDAGMAYAYEKDQTSGSVQKSFESVMATNADARIWLLRYYKPGDKPLSLSELKAENEGYCQLKAYKEGRVYGCNTASSTFFEDTPFRPDLLLKDFVVIAHPELEASLGSAGYFQKLK